MGDVCQTRRRDESKPTQNLRLYAVALVVLLSLTGCFPTTVWEKPGATQAEWEQTKASCMLEGAAKVPVSAAYVVAPGDSYTTTNCDKHQRNCSSYETYTPPTVQQVDTSAGLRDQVVRACLYRNGWAEKTK